MPNIDPAKRVRRDIYKKLWKHQRGGFNLAVKNNAMLFDMGMGTGKTLMELAFIDVSLFGRVVIACPKSVIKVWKKEFDAWSPDAGRFAFLDRGSVAQKAKTVKDLLEITQLTGERMIVVVNYDSMWREPLKRVFYNSTWDLCICDEGHRIKSPGSKVSQFFKAFGKRCHRRHVLSGTPMPNGPLDIYGVYRFLDPSIFGTEYSAFRAGYAVPNPQNEHHIIRYVNVEDFQRKVNTIRYHVGREVLDLPDAVHRVIPFELSSKARRVYDDLSNDMYAIIEKLKKARSQSSPPALSLVVGDDPGDDDSSSVTVDNVLVKSMRLQQIASGFVPIDDEHGKGDPNNLETLDDGRAVVLRELLEDLGNQPVVIFARFHYDLDQIIDVCGKLGITVAELSGRRKELEKFQDGQVDAIAVQITAGAEGIDLTRAEHAIFYSHTNAYALYEQALCRTDRPDAAKRKDVTRYFHHIVCENSIDEKIRQSYAMKCSLIDLFLGGTEKRAAA